MQSFRQIIKQFSRCLAILTLLLGVSIGYTPAKTGHVASDATTAQVWVDGGTGTGCARSGGAAYSATTACADASAACTKAQAGDTVAIRPKSSGTYGSTSVSCTKAITFMADTNAHFKSLSFGSGSSNFRWSGGIADGCNECGPTDYSQNGSAFVTPSGAMALIKASNLQVDHVLIHNTIYIESVTSITLDHLEVAPDTSLTDATCSSGGQMYCGAPYHTAWDNGDMFDIYEQSGAAKPANNGITVSNSLFHGLRSIDTSIDPKKPALHVLNTSDGKYYDYQNTDVQHSDGIQFCNCGESDSKFAQNIKITGNKFYDNESINIRTNANTDLEMDNNVFGDSVDGAANSSYYSIDVIGAAGTFRNNTFTGGQSIQANASWTTPGWAGQTWIGNAGNGHSTSCGVSKVTWSHNVWKNQNCGPTDKKVASLKLNSDGTPQAGSPVIDAGDPASFPVLDFLGNVRKPNGQFVGAAPDAGAFESGASGGGGGTGGPIAYDHAGLNTLIQHYGMASGQTSAEGDLNGDGAVNVYDLGTFLRHYTP